MKGGKKHFTILNVNPKHNVLVLECTLDICFFRITFFQYSFLFFILSTILSEIRIFALSFYCKKHRTLKNFICHVFSCRFYLSKMLSILAHNLLFQSNELLVDNALYCLSHQIRRLKIYGTLNINHPNYPFFWPIFWLK